MERRLLSAYTMELVEPFVADALYELTKRYTCREIWIGPKFDQFGSRQIAAQPLFPPLRHKRVISPSARLYAALAEYTCKVFGGAEHPSFAVYPGEKRGEVHLTAGVGVEFKVYEGRSDSIQLANGDTVSGIVCLAQEYRLDDDTVCVKLDTRAGNIWLRSKPKTGMFERRLFPNNQAPGYLGAETVVALAEWNYDRAIGEPWSLRSNPWEGLETRDTSGRPWLITKSEVTFGGGMGRLSLDDMEVERFRGRPRLKLEPPYEVIWQPPPFNFYVPLTEY